MANEGRTPIWAAACNGHEDTVRALAQLGANINTPNNGGATPLWIAAQNGHAATVRALIELGADYSAAPPSGTLSARGRAQDATDRLRLRQMARGDTPLHIACLQGEYGCVDAFCTAMGQPTLAGGHALGVVDDSLIEKPSNSDGATPLLRAAEGGCVDVADLLIRYGADIAAHNVSAETALHVAFAFKHDDMAAFLLRSGAKGCLAHKRCQKCALSLKILERKLARERVEAAAAPRPPAAAPGGAAGGGDGDGEGAGGEGEGEGGAVASDSNQAPADAAELELLKAMGWSAPEEGGSDEDDGGLAALVASMAVGGGGAGAAGAGGGGGKSKKGKGGKKGGKRKGRK